MDWYIVSGIVLSALKYNFHPHSNPNNGFSINVSSLSLFFFTQARISSRYTIQYSIHSQLN